MTTKENLEEYFQTAKKSDDRSVHQAFVKELLSSSDTAQLNCHYELLKERENWMLYCEIRLAFSQRSGVESFLTDRLAKEIDSDLIADVIHILGRQRSPIALETSIRYASYKDEKVREVVAYVLGWVGAESELPV
jgi:HEAT repeat protein